MSRPERTRGPGAGDVASRPSSLAPPPREPGPPAAETPAQVERAAAEARQWVDGMVAGGFSRREVASMADIRGYRLYRRRMVAQAREWLEAAVRADPSFEPALYHAAQAAALGGDLAAARAHLGRLRALSTPMGRRLAARAASDPDLARLRRAGGDARAR